MNIRLIIEPHASEALKEFVREGLALYNVACPHDVLICFRESKDLKHVVGGRSFRPLMIS
jgi:hypothetical protein